MIWEDHIPSDIRELYEIHEAHHAAAILAKEFPAAFEEVCDALRTFQPTVADVKEAGGSESRIPKKFSDLMRPLGWVERQLTAKLLIDEEPRSIDTHRVDYVKGRIALDLEWNSKDQTFDRDLYAFRAFFEYGKISVAVLLTRGRDLEPWFKTLGDVTDKHGVTRPVAAKFGASTTNMVQLIRRLNAGRNGGCPVLVFGITTSLFQRA
jgi:CRISPR-associated protein Csd2